MLHEHAETIPYVHMRILYTLCDRSVFSSVMSFCSLRYWVCGGGGGVPCVHGRCVDDTADREKSNDILVSFYGCHGNIGPRLGCNSPPLTSCEITCAIHLVVVVYILYNHPDVSGFLILYYFMLRAHTHTHPLHGEHQIHRVHPHPSLYSFFVVVLLSIPYSSLPPSSSSLPHLFSYS